MGPVDLPSTVTGRTSHDEDAPSLARAQVPYLTPQP